MSKFVTASCPCGTSFQREVKRGRPQVWCPACSLVPFYERLCVPVTDAKGETFLVHREFVAEVPAPEVVVSERIVNENDRLDAVRPEIEAGMGVINADHKALYASLVASGLAPMDAADRAQAVTLSATQNLYAEHGPRWYTPGREVD